MVAKGTLDLVKSAEPLLRERSSASRRLVIIVDQTGIVDRLAAQRRARGSRPLSWQLTSSYEGSGSQSYAPFVARNPLPHRWRSLHTGLRLARSRILRQTAVNGIVQVVEHRAFPLDIPQVVVATTTGIEVPDSSAFPLFRTTPLYVSVT